MSIPSLPQAAVLQEFGVSVVEPLGGRANLHWLVGAGSERLVLRRWAPSVDAADLDYELRLLAAVGALGWPVAVSLAGPIQLEGYCWSLFSFLAGEPPLSAEPRNEQRTRGRLLAEFHGGLSQLKGFGQRGQWRRCEQILSDSALDAVLGANERAYASEIPILRWHLDRARERISALKPDRKPGMVVHGDFTAWNLRFLDGHLSGILDFELAHWDHRIGDFALSWRGTYDEVVHGYHEVSPLDAEEWEMLTPMWWAFLIDLACRCFTEGQVDDGWIMKMLLRRSPLMGIDRADFEAL